MGVGEISRESGGVNRRGTPKYIGMGWIKKEYPHPMNFFYPKWNIQVERNP